MERKDIGMNRFDIFSGAVYVVIGCRLLVLAGPKPDLWSLAPILGTFLIALGVSVLYPKRWLS